MLKQVAATVTASFLLAAIALATTAKPTGSAVSHRALDTAPAQLDRIAHKLDSVYAVISQQPDGVTVNKR
jgi:hypothetical protein